MSTSVAEIAQQFDLEFSGDGNTPVVGVCGLSDNLENHLSFVADTKFNETAAGSRIGAFVTKPDGPVSGKANLFHAHPEYAIARIAGLFVPTDLTTPTRIADSAIIDPTATIASTARIGPNCVIGASTTIGDNTRIIANATVMDRVTVGADCLIHPGCVVREDCELGDRVILQPGAIVGGDGFGFVQHEGEHVKIPQLGNVIVESDVEIGANCSIDRGRFTATKIGRGTKIDNAVMIAHNVQIGERCLLVAQTGISGSSRLGDGVITAGQVGLVGHINIADHVTLLGQSMATKDIRESGAVWAGSPARPVKQWKRAFARLYAGLAKD